MYIVQLPRSPTFHYISFYSQLFSSYWPYWDKRTEWPQIDINITRSKVPRLYHNYLLQLPNFTPCCSMTSWFRQIQAILRQVNQMTAKWTWTPKGQRCPHAYHNYPQVSNFTQLRSMACSFGVTRHFETNAPSDPKMTLNTERSNVPHIHSATKFKILSRSPKRL